MRSVLASRALLSLLLAALVPASALAQVAPGATPAPVAPPPLGPPAGAATPAAVPLPRTGLAVSPPAVQDPMLEPMPAATKTVGSWREALALVRARSTDLRSALLDIERAEAQGRVALAAALPTLTAGANVTDLLVRTTLNPLDGTPTTQVFPPRPVTYGGSIQMVVPIFAPRAWYGIVTAEQATRASELSAAEQRRLLAAAVADALVGVVTAERVAEINRVGLRAALERLVLTGRRAELGAANALDVLKVEQDAATARAAIVTGDENLRQAREALGLALGFAEPWGVPRDLNLDAFAQESERACPNVKSVEDRTDLAAARQQTELSRRAVHDIELSFLPTVNLQTTYSLTAQPFYADYRNSSGGSGGFGLPGGVVDRTNVLHTWTIAGTLSWVIFDGGARYGNLRDTRAQVEQAVAREEKARRSASLEIVQKARSVDVTEQSRKVAQSNRDLARETDRLTRLSFDLGRGTSLELVDAGRALRQAEIQLAVNEFQVVQAKIRTLLALSTCEY